MSSNLNKYAYLARCLKAKSALAEVLSRLGIRAGLHVGDHGDVRAYIRRIRR